MGAVGQMQSRWERGRGRGRGALVILEGSEHVDDVEVVDLLEDLLLGLHVLDLQGKSAAECGWLTA